MAPLYKYDYTAGDGVNVYVIGTGVAIAHNDFEGRAQWGTNIIKDGSDTDSNGMDTHVAGTIAGRKYGVAKHAKVIAIKALYGTGTGSLSDVLNGLAWAVEDHKTKRSDNSSFKGSVAYLHLPGGQYTGLAAAVDVAIEAGVHVVLPAGNDNVEKSCDAGGAPNGYAFAVGASTLDDQIAYFSNFGPCIDLFAPGMNVESTYIGSTFKIATLSGTEMAAAHVAGLLAYFLSLEPAGSAPMTPKELKDMVLGLASNGLLNSLPPRTVNVSQQV
ncbi:MAG: hypothetical protein Q9217_000951 [Psora testacea]